MDWLTRVFGFTEKLRYAEPDGRISHAEMAAPNGAVIMLGSADAERAARPPASPDVFLVVDVDDVDAHYRRSTGEGASVLRELVDKPYGVRTYSVTDLEGIRWDFTQQVREVAPEEWGATVTG